MTLTRHARIPATVRLLAVFFVLLAAAVPFAARPALAQVSATLDVNAKIHVTVAGEDDLTGDYTVDPNGDITMLYINQVHVLGLTTEQTQVLITQKLSVILKNPQVLVQVIAAGGMAVQVTGAISDSGTRALRSDAHLNDLLQLANPSLDADLSAVEVTHGLPGGSHTTDIVNYLAYLDNKDPAGNPALQNGDSIFVRHKLAVPIQVFVRGEVAKPGRYSVPAGGTYVDGVQAAGGFLNDADRRNTAIQHSGDTAQIPVNGDRAFENGADPEANPVLQDGDIIIVKTAAVPAIYVVSGAVAHPQEFPLPDTPVTLADAIGKAGGPAPYAQIHKTTIVRKGAGGVAEIIKVDAGDPKVQGATIIQAGDNIEVPQGHAPPEISPVQLFGVLVGIYALTKH
jgi:protein involved in polysaccharide export with SLBB domain